MASVEITTPDGAQQITLRGDHVTIGRLTTNDIALPYSHISRRHAELRLVSGSWRIADLQSTNGIHINGQRVQDAPLAPGELITLSPHVSLRLLLTQAASEPPPPAPAAPPDSQLTPLSAYGPRSPYAEDETPFYPQMRPAPPRPSEPKRSEPRALPMSAAPPGAARNPPGGATGQDATRAADSQRQSERAAERRRAAAGAHSSRLHICQTCGQLTAPDAVYCQSCHHAISTECPRCRFSLLPVQELCPRCQTPNPGSVKRVRHFTEH